MRSLHRNLVRFRIAVVMACFVTALAASLVRALAETPATDRIESWISANESLRAGFSQSVFDEDGVRIGESKGTVAFLRPYRFRWDYVAPGPQVIVADGNEVWWYDADLQQVTVRPVESALEGTPAVLLAGPRRVDEHFRITGLPSADGVDWVELIPRSEDAVFRAIRLGMQGSEVRTVEMDDGFGQTTRIEFFDVERNPTLDERLFRFVPPPEADVIRGG